MQQSPFENIFNIIGGLSEGNEKPMKHGFYNAFALFILAICCVAVYVLFLILEPFFKPLFWALLVGSILHPFKYRLSQKLKTWFEDLEKTNTSVIFGLMIIPVNVVNLASDTVGHQFKEHYKTVIGLLLSIFVLPWLYNSVPRSFSCIFWQLTSFIGFSTTMLITLCSSYITLTIVLAYLISVYTLWTPQRAVMFRTTSQLLWLVITSFVASLCGSFQVYVFVVLQAICVTGFALEVLDVHKKLLIHDPEASMITAIHDVFTNGHKEEAQKLIEDKQQESSQPSASEQDLTPEKDTPSPVTPESVQRGSWATSENIQSSPRHNVKKLYKTKTLSDLPIGKMKSAYENRLIAAFKQRSLDENYMKNNFNNDEETALYFKLLFFGCFCMLVFKHIWLLPVLLFFLAIHVLKRLLEYFGVWLFFENQYNNVMAKINNWWSQRESALIPAYIRGVGKMMSICNNSMREMCYGSVDTVSSCFVIIGLILFLTVAIIFICIQIYSEAIVVVQLSGSLLNSTFVQNSELHAYLPEGWEDKLDSLIDNAYTYGREGISTAVRSILKEGDPEKIARVEQQILEIWDRVYQSWVSGHFASPVGPQVDGNAIQDSWESFVNDVSNTPGLFDYSGLVAWVKANLGTLSAIATSMWAPLASNVSLLAGSVGAFTSLLLCGGGAIINMFINLVVFFTTLFYLLASSNALYKPVEVITQVQPNFGPRLGIALSVAINQVFRASFKMALFYGLWTWLVHNLFGAKVVYLPSVPVTMHRLVPCLVAMLGSVLSVRINFTHCQTPEWTCVNNVPNEIVYNCNHAASNDFIIHIKDYYTDHITSVTVQNCRDLRVVLDCPLLQRSSQLEKFKIKDCDRLQFISLSASSLLQTPPEVSIENVREIVSFPRNLFKSPVTPTEVKCLGSTTLKKIRIVNSKINSIKTKAIHNVTGIKSIEFENVTISAIENNAIETFMDNNESLFVIRNSKINNIDTNGITVSSKSVSIVNNNFGDIMTNVLNITSDDIHIVGNTFKDVSGLVLKSVSIAMSHNNINTLRSNALTNVKCTRKRTKKRQFMFTGNTMNVIEPYSIIFDYNSCKSFGGSVIIKENKMDCTCRNIAFLQAVSANKELNNLILDVTSNNTCQNVPCSLPVDVVKLLLESGMCDLNLDSQVMCLLYNDRHSIIEVTTDEDVTLPTPTFYLIRAATSQKGDASAAMTAIDRDDILKESNLNMSNRTTVKIVFDSSRDFVETLRSTSTNKGNEIKPKEEVHRNRCVGEQCKNIFINDRQKALDFYKYVYAQLRSPLQSTDKTKT